MLPYIPRMVVQIGAATVPPIALLAAVHGIALAVRAGASGTGLPLGGRRYAAIGVGAFAVSFLALRDLMLAIGYSLQLHGLPRHHRYSSCRRHGDAGCARGQTCPARSQRDHSREYTKSSDAAGCAERKTAVTRVRSAQSACADGASRPRKGFASVQLDPTQTVRSAQAEVAQDDADLASDLIASGVTTQSVDTVIAVLSAHRNGASINAAAKASGINYRTAQRIVEAAAERDQRGLVAVG